VRRFFFSWFFAGILVLFLVWEGASRISGSILILPGPLPVLKRLFALVRTGAFFCALGNSFFRVILGLFISVPLGIGAGIAAGLDKRAAAFLKPLFSIISATPVMSVILIAFLWFGQERTPVFTAFLIVFPVIAANTIEGVKAADPQFKELFRVYPLSRWGKLRFFYIPSLAPFVLGGLRSALSLCWKVVIAAEVLVLPVRALGTGMQTAKMQLETPELFAWTAAAVCAAAFTQFFLTLILGFSKRKRSGA
jgi:NitT/TauT family transport system permease protein